MTILVSLKVEQCLQGRAILLCCLRFMVHSTPTYALDTSSETTAEDNRTTATVQAEKLA